MAVSREALCRKYNFKDIRVATWRDPYSAYAARAAGDPVVAADAFRRPYVPKYRLVMPSAKVPETTDDEESDEDDSPAADVVETAPQASSARAPEGVAVELAIRHETSDTFFNAEPILDPPSSTEPDIGTEVELIEEFITPVVPSNVLEVSDIELPSIPPSAPSDEIQSLEQLLGQLSAPIDVTDLGPGSIGPDSGGVINKVPSPPIQDPHFDPTSDVQEEIIHVQHTHDSEPFVDEQQIIVDRTDMNQEPTDMSHVADSRSLTEMLDTVLNIAPLHITDGLGPDTIIEAADGAATDEIVIDQISSPTPFVDQAMPNVTTQDSGPSKPTKSKSVKTKSAKTKKKPMVSDLDLAAILDGAIGPVSPQQHVVEIPITVPTTPVVDDISLCSDDKHVSFAPDTPEPKETKRKKKTSKEKDAKKTKRRSSITAIDVPTVDLSDLLDQPISSIPLPPPPPPPPPPVISSQPDLPEPDAESDILQPVPDMLYIPQSDGPQPEVTMPATKNTTTEVVEKGSISTTSKKSSSSRSKSAAKSTGFLAASAFLIRPSKSKSSKTSTKNKESGKKEKGSKKTTASSGSKNVSKTESGNSESPAPVIPLEIEEGGSGVCDAHSGVRPMGEEVLDVHSERHLAAFAPVIDGLGIMLPTDGMEQPISTVASPVLHLAPNEIHVTPEDKAQLPSNMEVEDVSASLCSKNEADDAVSTETIEIEDGGEFQALVEVVPDSGQHGSHKEEENHAPDDASAPVEDHESGVLANGIAGSELLLHSPVEVADNMDAVLPHPSLADPAFFSDMDAAEALARSSDQPDIVDFVAMEALENPIDPIGPMSDSEVETDHDAATNNQPSAIVLVDRTLNVAAKDPHLHIVTPDMSEVDFDIAADTIPGDVARANDLRSNDIIVPMMIADSDAQALIGNGHHLDMEGSPNVPVMHNLDRSSNLLHEEPVTVDQYSRSELEQALAVPVVLVPVTGSSLGNATSTSDHKLALQPDDVEVMEGSLAVVDTLVLPKDLPQNNHQDHEFSEDDLHNNIVTAGLDGAAIDSHEAILEADHIAEKVTAGLQTPMDIQELPALEDMPVKVSSPDQEADSEEMVQQFENRAKLTSKPSNLVAQSETVSSIDEARTHDLSTQHEQVFETHIVEPDDQSTISMTDSVPRLVTERQHSPEQGYTAELVAPSSPTLSMSSDQRKHRPRVENVEDTVRRVRSTRTRDDSGERRAHYHQRDKGRIIEDNPKRRREHTVRSDVASHRSDTYSKFDDNESVRRHRRRRRLEEGSSVRTVDSARRERRTSTSSRDVQREPVKTKVVTPQLLRGFTDPSKTSRRDLSVNTDLTKRRGQDEDQLRSPRNSRARMHGRRDSVISKKASPTAAEIPEGVVIEAFASSVQDEPLRSASPTESKGKLDTSGRRRRRRSEREDDRGSERPRRERREENNSQQPSESRSRQQHPHSGRRPDSERKEQATSISSKKGLLGSLLGRPW